MGIIKYLFYIIIESLTQLVLDGNMSVSLIETNENNRLVNYIKLFLLRCRLIDYNANITTSKNDLTFEPLANNLYLKRIIVRKLEQADKVKDEGSEEECHMYIFQDYKNLDNFMRWNYLSIDNLMEKNILVVALSSIISIVKLDHQIDCYYLLRSDVNKDMDKLNTLERLKYSPDISTVKVSNIVHSDDFRNNIEHMFINETNDIINTYGADYILTIYRGLLLEHKSVGDTYKYFCAARIGDSITITYRINITIS